MALTRPNVKVIQLGSTISDRLSAFVEQRSRIRNRQETEFLTRVVDEGLSYQEQVTYRKEQLANEKKKGTPDNQYISELKSEISRLNKLNREQKFRDSYRASLEQVQSQQKSYDQHIAFLQREADSAVDPTLRDEINQKLSDARIEKFNLYEQAITDRSTFAQSSKSVSLLQQSINEVKTKRSKADAAGDEAAVARWSALLSTLESDVAAIGIQDSYDDLSIKNMQSPVNSVDLLNFYRENLKKVGATNTPVYINGNRYDNASDFWQSQLNDYVNNTFFKNYQAELQDKLDVASKRLTPVLEAETRTINDEISRLSQSSELIPFAEQFNNLKTNINFSAAQQIGQKVLDDYNEGLLGGTAIENYTNARNRLETLNKTYNVDVTQYLSTITQDLAEKKGAAASEIARLVEEEGVSFEEASKRVKAVDIPTKTVAEKSATETAKDISTTTPTPTQFDVKAPAPASQNQLARKTEPEPTPAPAEPGQPVATPSATTVPKLGSSQGFSSVVDYLKSQKQDSSFQSRAKLYEQSGLGKSTEYKGSAEQNTALLDYFKEEK